MSHHHPRPVDPPRNTAGAAHQRLRFMLGTKVGMVEAYRFIEHLLGKYTAVAAGHRDGAHEVKATRFEILCEIECVPGSRHVAALERRGVGAQVVERTEMNEMPDGAAQLLAQRCGYAQELPVQVTLDRNDQGSARAVV